MSTATWMKLKDIQGAYITDPVNISRSKFVVVDYDNYKYLMYDAIKNDWQIFDQHNEIETRSITYDNIRQKYYFYILDTTPFVVITDANDITNYEKVMHNDNDEQQQQQQEQQEETNGYGRIGCAVIFANGNLHIIGGQESKLHTIFNPTTKKFTNVHTFDEWDEGILNAGLLYVSSKNYLLLLGGGDSIRWKNEIWKCDMNDINMNEDGKYSYKWNKTKLKLPKK